MNKSHHIAYLINKYFGPEIKNLIKKFYYYCGFFISIIMRRNNQEIFSKRIKFNLIPKVDKKYSSHFGYYDRTSISLLNELIVDTYYKKKDPSSSYIYIHNLKDIEKKSLPKIDPICFSRAHNIQQGNLTSWFISQNQDALIFNDISNCNLFSCAVFFDKNKIKEIKRYPLPIQTISSILSKAISIDYFKLLGKRSEYSYQNKFFKNSYFDKNLIVEFSLKDGNIISLISKNDLPQVENNTGKIININDIDDDLWNINHALYSPSGKRFIFLIRIYDNRKRRISNLIYKDENGKIKFAFAGIISHYCFIGETKLFIWGKPKDSNLEYPQFFIYSLTDFSIEIIESLKKFSDGHPTFSEKLSSIVFDTYPNFERFSSLYLFNLNTLKVSKLINVRIPPEFYGNKRIDLHPRFSSDGKTLTFDTYDHINKKPTQAILKFI